MRAHPLILTVLAAALVLLVGAGAIAWHDTTQVSLERVTLHSAKVKAPVRVLQLTDLHDARLDDQIEVVRRYLAETKPDAIAVTGDLVNTTTTDYSRVERWLRMLTDAGVPVYAVRGNHDYWNDNITTLDAVTARAGVRDLTQRTVPLDGGWGRVDLIGVDDYYSPQVPDQPTTSTADLTAASRGVRAGTYRLVITHAPEIKRDLPGSGIDLAICGHTHGGQIALPLVGPLYAPGQGFLPSHASGRRTYGDTVLSISNGVGTTGPPVRFFAPSSVTLYSIEPAA